MQRLTDGQLWVHHVVLRHHADAVSHDGVLGVHPVPFEGHLARRRLGVADDQPGQGGLARPGRADDRGQ
ncbi:Uncharacterised protein [Mycobacteroides abscessus subsp. massiliense]|nr:Uncharacterised protein [Mycobacteroides abscessus subsp. massiliense]